MATAESEAVEALTTAPVVVVPIPAISRHSLFTLQKKRQHIMTLADHLLSNRKYISRDDRDLLIFVLKFLKVHCPSIEITCELDALRATSRNPIERSVCCKIQEYIMEVLTEYAVEYETIAPINDEERFDLMIDRHRIITEYWREFRQLGIIVCNVLRFSRKFELVGTAPAGQFYTAVKVR